MKKILLATVFMLATHIGTAQVSDAFKADVKKYLEISGANAQMASVKKQILEVIPPVKQVEFTKEFETSLLPLFKAQEDFYTKEFTHDDIKQMIKYYESPAGKKYVQKIQLLDESIGKLSEEWGAQIEQLVMKYSQ